MTRLRPKTGIATAAALAFALSACGGGSDYCDALTAAEDKYRDTGDLDPTDVEALSEAQDAIAEVAASAPDEVQDAWQDAADAFQMLVDVDGDLTAIDAEEIERFANLQQDMDTATEHAQEECDIDLG